MRTRLTLSILSIFAVAAMNADAAGLRGTVVDPDGGGVPNASLTLYSRASSAGRATRSDGAGRYRLDGLGAGSYLLRVSAEGFAVFTTEEIELAGSADLELDIPLEVARLQTEVIVTASSTPLMIEEVAKATDVIGSDEIDLRDEHFLGEVLRQAPGFLVQQRGGPGTSTAIYTRGLRTYNTAILLDGIRLRDASDTQGSMQPFWQDLMIVTPARVEVLRGSGASLYGSHAMGGVVNLVTDSGGGAPHGEVLVEGGGLGTARGLAKLAGGAFDNRLLYSGGLMHLNVTRGYEDVNPARNTSGQAFLQYRFRPGIEWSGRLLATDAFARLTDSPNSLPEVEVNQPEAGVIPAVPLPDDQVRLLEQGLSFTAGDATYIPSLNDPDDRRAGRFVNFATSVSHRVSQALAWRATYQLLDSSRRIRQGPGGQLFEPAVYSNDSRFDGRIHTLQLRADAQAGRHNLLSGGYEFEDESYENFNTDESPDATFDRSEVRQRSHSLFAQDQIRIRDLLFALSGRVQTFHLRDPRFTGGDSPYAGIAIDSPKSALTGDAAVSYLFRPTGTKWRAHVGNSYRAPSLFERYGSSFFFGAFSPFGDPSLRPERALSLDLGLDQYLAGSRLKLSATYFYTALQEIILFDFSGLIPLDDPFGRFGGYLNVRGGLARGAELSMEARPTNLTRLKASYTYTNSDASPDLSLPEHLFTALVSQWIGRRVNVTFDVSGSSSYNTQIFTSRGTRWFSFDGSVKADLVARYVRPLADARSLEFFIKLDNLGNRNLYDRGFRTPGIWATGGLRLLF